MTPTGLIANKLMVLKPGNRRKNPTQVVISWKLVSGSESLRDEVLHWLTSTTTLLQDTPWECCMFIEDPLRRKLPETHIMHWPNER